MKEHCDGADTDGDIRKIFSDLVTQLTMSKTNKDLDKFRETSVRVLNITAMLLKYLYFKQFMEKCTA